jgi:prolyl oligopeptidase
MRIAFILLPAALLPYVGAVAQPARLSAPKESAAMSSKPVYPATTRGDVRETLFGEEIVDPYRWLENDVRTDANVRAWVTAQVATTDAYLATLPGRVAIATRMKALWDYERFGLPETAGAHIFYQRNTGLQNQSPLYVQDGEGGTPRLLIDPNLWAADGATALSEWKPSDDGKRLVYAVQDGGTDWRTLKVLDVGSGKVLDDEVRWAKFTNLAWAKNGTGFFYSRFPEPAGGAAYQSLNLNHAVYFHAIGTPQTDDRLVFATKDRPKLNHSAEVTEDGRWLLVTSSEGTDARYELTLIDLMSPKPSSRTLVRGLEHAWQLAGVAGDQFYFVTDLDAPRQRVVAMDVSSASRPTREIVAESDAKLEAATIAGNRLVLSYLRDAKSELELATLDGTVIGTVALPGIGSVTLGEGRRADPTLFYSYGSYAVPTSLFRLDTRSGADSLFKAPQVAFDPGAYAVEQRFYASKDGTRVPMFVIRRKDVTGPVPTILYGYGGFDISLTPGFSPAVLQWLEMGGAYAVANLRGGGEYGKAWHDGGRLANKQNVFDDCIAAAEYLITQGIAKKDGLALSGRSNGGLLVGAVVNQRPDLFAAAIPGVGVMDMLRFNRFTAGRYWTDDYGDPAKEADFKVLRRYSPYHNIRSGTAYPAIMVATADTDDRVVPGHSFKYAAALQAADIGEKPHLIRIETRAGHGSGKPTDKVIEEYSDLWTFVAKWTGLTVPN